MLHDEIVLHVPSSFFRRRERPRSCCPAEVLQTDLNRHSRFVSRVTAADCYCCHRHSCQLCQLSAFSCRTLSDSQVDGARPALVQLLKESVEAPALAAAAEALRQLAEEPTQRWAETKKMKPSMSKQAINQLARLESLTNMCVYTHKLWMVV